MNSSARRTSRQQVERLRRLADRLSPWWMWLTSPAARAAVRWVILLAWPLVGFGGVLLQSDQLQNFNDFADHARFAQAWSDTGTAPGPHFLNEALVIAVKWLVPGLDWVRAQWVATEAVYVATVVVLYLVLGRLAPAFGRAHPTGLALATVSLLLVEPITLLTVARHHLYAGYIVPANVFHNPTVLLLRPIAVLTFWLVTRGLDSAAGPAAMRLGQAAALIGLTVLGTLAKPNYTMCLVPALLVVVACDPAFRRSAGAWTVAAAVALPGLALLTWQYARAFGPEGDPRAGVIFEPFALVTDRTRLALAKFALSLAFPAAVAILFRRALWMRTWVRLGWLSFLIACGFNYVLLEGGVRAIAGNFGWGCQVTLFVLFAWSLAFLLEESERATDPRPGAGRLAGCWVVYGLHLASGLLYFLVHWQGAGHAWL